MEARRQNQLEAAGFVKIFLDMFLDLTEEEMTEIDAKIDADLESVTKPRNLRLSADVS